MFIVHTSNYLLEGAVEFLYSAIFAVEIAKVNW